LLINYSASLAKFRSMLELECDIVKFIDVGVLEEVAGIFVPLA
jgi:hypothetical protein